MALYHIISYHIISYHIISKLATLSKKRYKSHHWGCTFSKGKTFVHFKY